MNRGEHFGITADSILYGSSETRACYRGSNHTARRTIGCKPANL
jgi:hypothetical protein